MPQQHNPQSAHLDAPVLFHQQVGRLEKQREGREAGSGEGEGSAGGERNSGCFAARPASGTSGSMPHQRTCCAHLEVPVDDGRLVAVQVQHALLRKKKSR